MADAVITSIPAVGGGGSSTSTAFSFEDQASAPLAAAGTAQIFSAQDASTRADVLYLFDDNVTNSGNLAAAGDGVNTGVSFVSSTLSGFDKAGDFDGTSDKVEVGTGAAPFRFYSDEGDRGDFELVFRFRVDSNTKTHSLLSTDPTTPANTDTGHYAVLLAASASADASRINFEYNIGGSLTTESFVVPGTLSTSADYHLVISFKTDVNTFAGSDAGVGKLRCYWDGVPCVLSGTSATFIAATMSGAGIGYSGSANWPLFLGQYLDGVASSGTADVHIHFDGDLVDVCGGSAPTHANPSYSATGFGQEIEVTNASINSGTEHVVIPDPSLGSGAFTMEFFVTLLTTTANQRICSSYIGGSVQNGDFELYIEAYDGSGGDDIRLKTYNSNGGLDYVYFNPIAGSNIGTDGRVHVALTRSLQGANYRWRLYIDGVFHSFRPWYSDLDTTGQPTLTGSNLYLGRGFANYCAENARFDEFRLTKNDTVYTAGQNFTPPSAAFSDPVDAASNFFDGKMDEFAVYNSRCIHNTDETFQVPTTPSIVTPLSLTSSMNSEGGHGSVLTVENAGTILPKSIEGLSTGSAWNDSGTVKIAP